LSPLGRDSSNPGFNWRWSAIGHWIAPGLTRIPSGKLVA
jgi:hypothetical protein